MTDDERKLLQELQGYRLTLKPKFPVIYGGLGNWESPYPGQGFEFLSARDWELGDNPRRVHLPTSERRGTPTVVERIELRDMTAMVYVDCSPSMRLRDKREAAIHVAALLLFGAFKLECSVGFGTLNDYKPIVRPRTGQEHFFLTWTNLHKSLLYEAGAQSRARGMIFGAFLEHLEAVIPPRSMVFVVSDFLGSTFPQGAEEKILRSISQRYDIIPVIVQDMLEYGFPIFPHSVCYPFQDAETGEEHEVWLSSGDQRRIAWAHQLRMQEIRQMFRRAGIRAIHPISWDLPSLFEEFEQFFAQRR